MANDIKIKTILHKFLWLIAIYAVVFGVILIALSLKLRGLHSQPKHVQA